MYAAADHTFAVCAYGESPYLATCLRSVTSQQAQSRVICCTATPSPGIERACAEARVPLYVNGARPSIAGDWNFAVEQAVTPLVTIAHQDDVYLPNYASVMLEAVNAARDPLIFFSDYAELRDGGHVVEENRLLGVKRLLLSPLKVKGLATSKLVRRRILSLGSAICCPSVTLVTPRLPTTVFLSGLGSNLDWEAWERVSRLDGSFVYAPQVLMHHRIHGGSETSRLIENDERTREDQMMFERFWPRPVAHAINRLYRSAQNSNR